MVEFFSSDTMLSITLIYMIGFIFYHLLVGVLWYFKKKVAFELYSYDNSAFVMYSIIQGGFILFGILTHVIYCTNTHLESITQYVVFLGLIIWIVIYLIRLLIVGRDKIHGDF